MLVTWSWTLLKSYGISEMLLLYFRTVRVQYTKFKSAPTKQGKWIWKQSNWLLMFCWNQTPNFPERGKCDSHITWCEWWRGTEWEYWGDDGAGGASNQYSSADRVGLTCVCLLCSSARARDWVIGKPPSCLQLLSRQESQLLDKPNNVFNDRTCSYFLKN